MPTSFLKSKTDFIPFLLFLLSFAVRFLSISKGPYHVDCLELAINAEKTLDTFQLHYLTGSGYPFTVILGTFFIFLTRLFSIHDPVFAVNLMSVTLSSGAIPVFYLLVKKIFNSTVALLSALMLSFSPIFLGVSVYGKNHGPALFLFLLAILFLLSYLQNSRKKDLFLSSVFLGLMGATRLQDLAALGLAISFLYFWGTTSLRPSPSLSRKQTFVRFLLFGGIAFLIIAVFHIPYFSQKILVHYQDQFSVVWQRDLMNNFRGLFSESLRFRCTLFLKMNFSHIGIIAVILGAVRLVLESKRTFVFLVLWFVPPLLFFGNLYTTAPRFFTPILPPLCIAQAVIFEKLLASPRLLFRSTGFLGFSLMISLVLSYMFPSLQFRHEHAVIQEYIQWVDQVTEKNARIVVGDESSFYRYFHGRDVIGRPMAFFKIKEEELHQFKNNIDSLLDEGIPVYIPRSSIIAYNPGKQFSTFILTNYELECVGEYLYASWHTDYIFQRPFRNHLFKLKKIPTD